MRKNGHPMITTQAKLRYLFWLIHQRPRKLKNGDYPCDTRMAWCDFIDDQYRHNQISEKLAGKATL